jgi:hypothetical protein
MHVSETTHKLRAVVEPLEAVISIQFSRSYKRELIGEFIRFVRKGFQKAVQ